MRREAKTERGVALVLTLAMLVLITILVVGLSSILSTERKAARSGLDNEKAKAMAEMACDHAVALLRDDIEPARVSGKFWTSQPGKITVFNTDGTVASTLDLSSGFDGFLPEVDLNQATLSGNNPIASAASANTTSAPSVNVNWINVYKDPAIAASTANPVVGRYAFWVDDESSKINVNTADGTSKYVSPDPTALASSAPVSYGDGMPTEVNLQALTNSVTSSSITAAVAQGIASLTGVRPGSLFTHSFNDASELLQTTTTAGSVYADNNFNLTHYSRSPELNIFGEPKINLMSEYHSVADLMAGPMASLTGVPLRQVYPSSNQLPFFTLNPNILTQITAAGGTCPANLPLPQFFEFDYVNNCDIYPWEYQLGLRIAQYLKGYDSQGNAITWPTFPGSTANGFGGGTVTHPTGKYTDRQIDSMALQMLDLLCKDTVIDASNYYAKSYDAPFILQKGFLSGLPVKGLNRGPTPTQVLMTFTVQPGNPPSIALSMDIQWYFPKEYKGGTIGHSEMQGWFYGKYHDTTYYLNIRDSPLYGVPSPFGIGKVGNGTWWNQLLRVTGRDGVAAEDDQDAGVDFYGRDANAPDYDQASAKTYHPWTYDAASGQYFGGGPEHGYSSPMLMAGFFNSNYNSTTWIPGDYHSSCNNFSSGLFHPAIQVLDPPDPANPQPFSKALTSLTISGGITIWADFDGRWLDCIPIDSCVGWVNGTDAGLPDPALTDPALKQALLAAVIAIPKDFTINLPPPNTLGNLTKTVVIKVADPLVNEFPGDWVGTVDPSAKPGQVTLIPPSGGDFVAVYQDGANVEFQAAGGGDPTAYWLPEVNSNIPKSARFPSVGYLQYIRTGLMPDPANDPNDPRFVPTVNGQPNFAHGTPFRLLSMAPSYDPAQYPTVIAPNPGQTTAGGGSYPDWAMLDLFTAPAVAQPLPPAPTALNPNPPLPPELEMTFGGSTAGRVNVNGVIQPSAFSAGASRLSPLKAVLKGLQVSNTYGPIPSDNVAEPPIMTTVDEAYLANKIRDYTTTLGRPLMMSAEIANVPEVANYTYTNSLLPTGAQAYWSRNDLVRQAVGNLTTQSNTFSVWAMGQSIRTMPDNSYQILGTSRIHYIVERYIDMGTDGVPGNAAANGAGPDGIVGTPDDVVSGDATHPGPNPAMTYPLPYKYRIIATKEVSD